MELKGPIGPGVEVDDMRLEMVIRDELWVRDC
jgi:hypothetical protein